MYGGNLLPNSEPLEAGRSIPACTGEPRTEYETLAAHTVYPRVYGGTFFLRIWLVLVHGLSPRVRGTIFLSLTLCTSNGLSPRVRGNRINLERREVKARSIPACTGEPGDGGRFADVETVYPRVYGGTDWP